MITEPHRISEGWMELTLASGQTYEVNVLLNDPVKRFFRVEKEDGFRVEISYGVFLCARRWENQKQIPGAEAA